MLWLTAGSLLLLALASMAISLTRHPSPPQPAPGTGPPMHVVPVTTLSGFADRATFSPDGNMVAFSWWSGDRTNGINTSIYVTVSALER